MVAVLELEFRVALAYLLLLKLGFSVWGRKLASPHIGESSGSPRTGRPVETLMGWTVQALFVGPFLVLLADPRLLGQSQINLPSVGRWLATLSAAASVLLDLWARRSQILPSAPSVADACEIPAWDGPYRWVRFPTATADAIFYLSLACISANWVAICCCASAVAALRLAVLPVYESRRRRLYGPAYGDYAGQTGMLLPLPASGGTREYTVPKRFGMAAVTATLTTFGIAFGGLKYAEAPPLAYVFVASLFVAVCLAQIVFGWAPRGGSIVAGAVLLPFWVGLAMTIRTSSFGNLREFVYLYRGLSPIGTVLFYLTVCLFGGLLGYCTGALAAGFFLVRDMFDVRRPYGQNGRAPGDGQNVL